MKFLRKLFLVLFIILISINSMAMAKEPKKQNIYGEELQPCCFEPLTGYFRDGFCRTVKEDVGTHVICAEVTEEFLNFTLTRGNNLISPAPQFSFPGLKPGDKWCLCALRWKEALQNNVAPPVYLDATDIKALDYVTLEQLESNSINKE